MKELREYVEQELKGLNRGFVATPDSREALESFAKTIWWIYGCTINANGNPIWSEPSIE